MGIDFFRMSSSLNTIIMISLSAPMITATGMFIKHYDEISIKANQYDLTADATDPFKENTHPAESITNPLFFLHYFPLQQTDSYPRPNIVSQ